MVKIIIRILTIIEIALILLIIVLSLHKKGLLFDAAIPSVNSVYLDDNNYVNINLEINANSLTDKIYYMIKRDSNIPDVNSKDWKLIDGDSIKYDFNDSYYTFLKNEDNVITQVNDTESLVQISNFNINKNTIYVAIKGTYRPTLSYDVTGDLNEKPYWYSENASIAKVDQNGKITGVKKGNTKVHAKLLDKEVSVDVVVTNLITVKPKKYDRKKSYLPCGKHTKEDNDLLDIILADRIKDAGYKTRAGAVEAARFLTLEFPYKIKYFSENGRLTGNGVDGEGRYYHKGLYLDESRYKSIKKKKYGPKTWGCKMYSVPSHKPMMNGLDCSGFISWVLYNGGFNVKDVGAGISSRLDLTDYGKRTKLTKKVVSSGKIKVGDLLASGGSGGGHIAMIVGETKTKYYVAESLWTPPNVAALVMEYSKSTFHKKFNYVMFMDKYYKKDGNLTKMWY